MTRSPATLTLIGISALLYLLVNHLGAEAVVRALLISEYTFPTLPEIRDGELWRLVTPIFLHFGIFHVVFNLLWVWEFGRLIEARHGAPILIAGTALLGALSNLGQYYAAGPGFGGMSGVVYGYFGYVWIQGRFNPAFGMRLPPATVYLLLGWFALAFSGVFAFFNLHIANTAHAVGLLSGIALALLGLGLSRSNLKPFNRAP